MITTELLNKEQQEGVFTTEGPVLILAGAGSGKTRVLTNRTAYLIKEKGINPSNILAITFTNKAAGEMKKRIEELVGYGAMGMWISTFHSCCVRILRRYSDRIGYDTAFTIYDADDQKTLIKDICKRLEIDTKQFKEKMFLSTISACKNELIDPSEYRINVGADYRELKKALVYEEYEKELRKNNAMDFDDLILKAVELLSVDKEVLNYYQKKFEYVMVDEYQDTNTAQFRLIKLLAGGYNNICVVGDDDQSIYKFRGANIRNILDFEGIYPDAKVIKLEQNYRSTKSILDTANAVIKNNRGRKDKALWTNGDEGEKVRFEQFEQATEEAYFVANDITKKVKHDGYKYNDCAILYRTNAQSRLFEERMVANNIPYRLVGGVNFYSRKEIKDLLAYLKTVDNGKDDVACKRILNIPKRGIGSTTESKIQAFAYENEMSFFDALAIANEIPSIGKAALRIEPFVKLIDDAKEVIHGRGIKAGLEFIIKETGYVNELKLENTEESRARIENIGELLSKAVDYEENAEEPSLDGFLEDVALIADIDTLDDDSDYVVLMTIHGAKGLEFSNVYLTGMEDGVFPSYMTITSDDPTDIEEERRLCYVGITRAKEHLVLSAAKSRLIHGEMQYNAVSRFVKEIPKDLLQGYVKQNVADVMKTNDTFRKAKQTYKNNYFASNVLQKGSELTKNQDGLSYDVGDRVKHIKFGEGTVLNIEEGKRDFEVTVEFDSCGVKKMYAMFAKLMKC